MITYINKKGGTHSADMFALLWRIISWCHHYRITLSQAHSRVPKSDGQCTAEVKSDPINRMVTSSADISTNLSKVVHSSCRPFCHSSEPQASSVHVSSPRSTCMGHRCSEHKLVGSHSLCVPYYSSSSQGDKKSGNAIATSYL